MLKVPVTKGPLGIHFLKRGSWILSMQGTYITASLGTGILKNSHLTLIGFEFRFFKRLETWREKPLAVAVGIPRFELGCLKQCVKLGILNPKPQTSNLNPKTLNP